MSAPISAIVSVTIERGTRIVTQAGFGIPLILGPNGLFPVGTSRDYSSIEEVFEDFDITDDEYKAANAIFSQSPRPELIKIGVRATPVAQVQTLDFDADFVTGNDIDLKINDVSIVTVPFNTDHATTLADLATEIQTSPYVSSALVTGPRQITITAQTAGVPVAITEIEVTGGISQANGTTTITVQNVGIANDILALTEFDKDWYALIITSRDEEEVKIASQTIEALTKIFFTASNDPDILDDLVTDDIASILQAKSRLRTVPFFNETPSDFADAAWLGRCLPEDPGSITWKFKTLSGIIPSDLTTNQRNNALAKNANLLTEIGGIAMTEEGNTSSGEFIDIVRGIDWLTARMQENIFSKFVNAGKIPYTDAGISIVENGIRETLDNAISQGIIVADPELYDGKAYEVNVPRMNDISSNDKAIRLLPDVTWEARLAGAIHRVIIRGKVVV